ncbi:MAG TPA: carbohydrate ABC transporter permease [Gordonia sp. (in: high G+C Gram-positive bacteria)]|jgi:multiple sugar transport system permease protein|uniref:Binding-protein-dependent transport systems inner membrane component n=2 Tax=Micrococcales TaxID=85006 RepID=A0A077M4J9_9MICO|nr:Binding-protein-dependent transport systems inner membrane component [Tetrasphaera jenkinsii Ben 74]HNP58897.1 carbohydrate ABC transporter permease [Gordonia sp. (in: high G+C Gram-positive bacteria)]
MSTSVGTAPQPTQKWKRGPLESVLPVAVMFTAMACFMLPLWYLFVASSKNRGDLTTTPGLWFSHFQLGTNVSDTVNRDGGIFWRWLLNSVLYAGVGAAIGTVIAAMAGYALAKYEFRGREATFNTILAGVLVPATALALPLFLIFAAVGLTNTYWSVLLPSLVSPFGVYLSRIYASASVPDALIEAARLDGVGEFRIFLMMATALMKPALVTIFLFQFVVIWNNFFLPLIMLVDRKLFPMTLGLYSWNSQTQQDPTLATAVLTGALLSVVPIIAAFLMLQRYWRGGLGAGGVKG